MFGAITFGGCELHPETCRHIACNTQMPGAIGTVASDIQIEHEVALHAECFEHIATQLSSRRQNQNARGVRGNTEFGPRAQHAFGVDAQNAAFQNVATIWHFGAQRGERHQVTSLHVERTTPHMAFDSVAGIYPHAVHFGGVSVPFGAQHLGHHHTVDWCADHLGCFHGQPERRDGYSQLVIAPATQVGEFFKPRANDAH